MQYLETFVFPREMLSSHTTNYSCPRLLWICQLVMGAVDLVQSFYACYESDVPHGQELNCTSLVDFSMSFAFRYLQMSIFYCMPKKYVTCYDHIMQVVHSLVTLIVNCLSLILTLSLITAYEQMVFALQWSYTTLLTLQLFLTLDRSRMFETIFTIHPYVHEATADPILWAGSILSAISDSLQL